MAVRFGKDFGIMVNSGSSANLLVADEIAPGSVVATPALTFPTTLAYLLDRDLELADVEEGTYQIDFGALEREPDVVVAPNLIGNVPNWTRAPAAAIVEDSCDTITDAGRGKSSLTTTSFYASHVITACGGGGMVMTNDAEVAARLRSKVAWGRTQVDEGDLDARFVDTDGMTYDKKFVFDHVGYNFLPLEVQAAFGLVQLAKLDTLLKIRSDNFDFLYRFFEEYEDRFLLPVTRSGANWLAFPLTIRQGIDRTDMVKYLELNGIQTRPILSGNITRQPAYRKILGRRRLPVADKIMRDGFLLGCHHGLTTEHLDYVTMFLSRYLDAL